MTFDMSNPIAYLDPLNSNLNHMLVMLLKDQLNEYLYDAELASLVLSVSTKSCGIDVSKELRRNISRLIPFHFIVYHKRL